MKAGIIGRGGSGRSTFFDALTGSRGAARPAGKVRLGIARVPDQRLDRLTELCRPKKTVNAELILALPPNATTGVIDVASVREMRDIGVYAQVVGAFGNERPEQLAAAEMAELNQELVLADMERVETRRARIAKGGGARPGEVAVLERAASHLDAERSLRQLEWDEGERALLDELGLLSQKPLLVVVNVAEKLAGRVAPVELEQAAAEARAKLLWLSGALEADIAELALDVRQEFLAAYGLSEPVAHRFVRATLELLDQICFFTVGPDEVRAWNIPRGTNARRAARAIHSDLEKGFIRAEVIDYDVFLEQGSEAKCKAAGKLRVEGKDYIVKDGDIINVRFNV